MKSFGILDTIQIAKLSQLQAYSTKQGFRGLIHNWSDAGRIRHVSIHPSELIEVGVGSDGLSLTSLPFTVVLPLVGRLRMSYEIGKSRHNYIKNRINKSAPQLTFRELTGNAWEWICFSENSCRAYRSCVMNLLYDNDVSRYIIKLHQRGYSRVESETAYYEFCEGIVSELEEHAAACAEHERMIQAANDQFNGHFNQQQFQRSYESSKHGYLTDDI